MSDGAEPALVRATNAADTMAPVTFAVVAASTIIAAVSANDGQLATDACVRQGALARISKISAEFGPIRAKSGSNQSEFSTKSG